ncbi:MAG TPA: M28 family metallopeptidase [Vicinamibacterales bacterium]|nr:M28 family metallopeptidase [Vicinamibacterales bacterium]
MPVSRRTFLQWAAAATTMASSRSLFAGTAPPAIRAGLLPSERAVWDQQVWMAKLGPKYTGNKAHTEFVEFLAREMTATGLEVQRERYTLPRWDARRTEIAVTPARGTRFTVPVTSYFPYSGQTPAAGVTGELAFAGTNPKFDLNNLKGKIALVECPTNVRKWGDEYRPWGIYPATETFPSSYRPARASVNDLTQFQKAGAVAVILIWTDISDANAKDQYSPFSRPPQGIPGLYVGRETGARLRGLIGDAAVTLVLEADVTPDTPTDTLVATLPGASSDEIIILNTHTDGPNATEENGALGILALMKYFAKIPRAERRRTIVCPLTTGHFASPWVPSIRGFITKYPDVIKKAVAAITVEHLGCMEWADDASMQYRATGKEDWAVAITPSKPMGEILVYASQGSAARRTAVVNPAGGGFLGEGSSLSRAGIPTIGYIPQPNYLLAGPQGGCIEKLSSKLMHAQIEVFAKAIHAIDTMTASELKA